MSESRRDGWWVGAVNGKGRVSSGRLVPGSQSALPWQRRHKCPTCEARVGQPCTDIRNTLYPKTIKSYHKERGPRS